MTIGTAQDPQLFFNRIDFLGPIYFGSSLDQTGIVNFFNSSSANATSFQAGNASAAITYTLPTAGPAGNNYVLGSSTTGVLSWINTPGTFAPIGSAYVTIGSDATLTSERALTGTSNQITVTDNGAGSTVVLSFPTTVDITTISHTGGTAIKGTNTNDNAAAGNIGEYVTASQTTSTNFPSSTNWGDGASISLTAGDWDISGALSATANAATFTRFQIGISSTTGNSTTGLVQGDNQLDLPLPVNGVRAAAMSIPSYRVSLSATTIYYLKVESEYSAGTPQYTCRISARRAR